MDYVQLLQTIVLPFLFYGGVLWVLSHSSRWLLVHVVQPWTERHLAFVDRMERSTVEHTIVLTAILKVQEEHARCLAEITRTLKMLQDDAGNNKGKP